MNQVIIDSVKNGLMWVCLWVLAAIAADVVGVWFCRSARSGGGALGDRALPSVGADHQAARTGNGALGDRALPGPPRKSRKDMNIVLAISNISIRRNICSRDFPSALEQDISLLPMVNWQLLPDVRSGDDSLLSYHFHEDFVVFQSGIDDFFVL